MSDTRHFYAALAHLSDFYGISLHEDQFENVALHAWDHIGNKNLRTYVFKGHIENNFMDLPCNADLIEAVLLDGESHNNTDGVNTWSRSYYTSKIEEYIQNMKGDVSIGNYPGRYVDYIREGNRLSFNNLPNQNVTVVYKGFLADQDGLPSLNFKEVDAIAKYCAFVEMQKKAMVTKDKATMELAQYMRQQWQVACDDARTPIFLNQNDMDQLLDVQSSWDRKRFGMSFKAIK